MHEEMYTKVWKREHLEKLPEHVPEAVKEEILDIIETLNQHYGSTREVDSDLGGYIAVFPESYSQADYEALLSHYHLSAANWEYQESVYWEGRTIWMKEVYLCGSDYSLVVIYPELLDI